MPLDQPGEDEAAGDVENPGSRRDGGDAADSGDTLRLDQHVRAGEDGRRLIQRQDGAAPEDQRGISARGHDNSILQSSHPMTHPDLIVRGRRVVTPEGVRPAAIHIRSGVIERVAPFEEAPAGGQMIDAGTAVVMPGIVDTHVHVNEPGRTEWEGFDTATRGGGGRRRHDARRHAAQQHPGHDHARGAATPRRHAADGQCHVDVGFWGGVVPGNAGELAELLADGRRSASRLPGAVRASTSSRTSGRRSCGRRCRCFAARGRAARARRAAGAHRGGCGCLGRRRPVELRSTTAGCARARRRPRSRRSRCSSACCREYRAPGAHRPSRHRRRRCRSLRAARAEGLPITVETCPHYLTFCAEEIPDGATPASARRRSASAPTARRSGRRCGTGDIDLVATDHSPCPPDDEGTEAGDFLARLGRDRLAPAQPAGGVDRRPASAASRSTASRMDVRRAGAARRDLQAARARSRRARTPTSSSGTRRCGFDVDPARSSTATSSRPTPAGRFGVVRVTILRGETVCDGGSLLDWPTGRPILRGGR